jgi:hypothetical protein
MKHVNSKLTIYFRMVYHISCTGRSKTIALKHVNSKLTIYFRMVYHISCTGRSKTIALKNRADIFEVAYNFENC